MSIDGLVGVLPAELKGRDALYIAEPVDHVAGGAEIELISDLRHFVYINMDISADMVYKYIDIPGGYSTGGNPMKARYRKLAREQLDATLKRFAALRSLPSPAKGWVRAIRDVLGMTGEQLANRLDVNKQRVARIEQDERTGSVTLRTLRRVAEAMDCVFVYGFVPRDSLDRTVRRQAELLARKRSQRTDQTMRLEKQQLDDKQKEKALQDLIADITEAMPKSLWDVE
jgi:predicted DNA-binding mobile mystery protein A